MKTTVQQIRPIAYYTQSTAHITKTSWCVRKSSFLYLESKCMQVCWRIITSYNNPKKTCIEWPPPDMDQGIKILPFPLSAALLQTQQTEIT